ncbi:MAG: tRNA lysidine(34) synthetase TilS [Candidatus Riflebacteria bacterium]|nr:tRNA lysidine(34) synthetase TilS [Candidatus Riflebacteria bacterium]
MARSRTPEARLGARLSLLATDRPRLLVAVSGGLDSMALLDLLARRPGLVLHAAHVDYRLRGSQSDLDRRAVERRCDELGVRVAIRRATDEEVGWLRAATTQARARELRYAFFREVLEREGLDWIVTAHHRDDQLETFFLKLMRGAGPGGLGGMAPLDPVRRLFRPLLDVGRDELENYVRERGLRYRQDRTNLSPRYDRNRVRHELIPVLTRIFGAGALEAIPRAMELLRDESAHLASLLAREGPALEVTPGGDLALEVEGLLRLGPVLARRAVMTALTRLLPSDTPDLSRVRVESVLSLASRSRPGRRLAFAGLEVLRERGRLVMRRARASASEERGPWPLAFEGETVLSELGVRAVATLLDGPPEPFSAGVLQADAASVQPPLVVRPPRKGDRIAPLGMGGSTVSVARHLSSRGLGVEARSRVLVVEDAAGPIWLAGHVVSHRVQTRSGTRRLWRLRLGPC